MGDQGFPQTHTTTTTHTSAQQVTSRPYFDLSYMKTYHGILKVSESILDFICFICVVCGPRPGTGGASWAEFVTIVSFIVTLVLLIMYLFHMIEILHVMPWLLAEMVYCALWALFYLIAASILAANASYYSQRGAPDADAWGAASFFGFVLMGLYGFDCFLKFRAWRAGEVAQGSVIAPTVSETQTTTTRTTFN